MSDEISPYGHRPPTASELNAAGMGSVNFGSTPSSKSPRPRTLSVSATDDPRGPKRRALSSIRDDTLPCTNTHSNTYTKATNLQPDPIRLNLEDPQVPSHDHTKNHTSGLVVLPSQSVFQPPVHNLRGLSPSEPLNFPGSQQLFLLPNPGGQSHFTPSSNALTSNSSAYLYGAARLHIPPESEPPIPPIHSIHPRTVPSAISVHPPAHARRIVSTPAPTRAHLPLNREAHHAHQPSPDALADAPHFRWHDPHDTLSSPISGDYTVFGPSAHRQQMMKLDASFDETEDEYFNNSQDVVPDPCTLLTNDNDYVIWKRQHQPAKLFPGGPAYLCQSTCQFLLREGRHGKCTELWEEGLAIRYYQYKCPPEPGLTGALLLPTHSGKKSLYHITYKELRVDIFLGARNNASLHRIVCGCANTYKLIMVFNKLNGVQYDFTGDDHQLVEAITPRLAYYQSQQDELKGVCAWRIVAYSRADLDGHSWLDILHFHLKNHPVYAIPNVHSGTLSSRPDLGPLHAGSRSKIDGTALSNTPLGGDLPSVAPDTLQNGGTTFQRLISVPSMAYRRSALLSTNRSELSLPVPSSAATVSQASVSSLNTDTRPPAVTKPPRLSGRTRSVSHESVAPRTGDRALSSAPDSVDTNSPPDISQAIKRELDGTFIAMK
ncbi:hypothetical protein RSAG8_05803, partial [Rhizoctonia solani AG-8 WAC10335]